MFNVMTIFHDLRSLKNEKAENQRMESAYKSLEKRHVKTLICFK